MKLFYKKSPKAPWETIENITDSQIKELRESKQVTIYDEQASYVLKPYLWSVGK